MTFTATAIILRRRDIGEWDRLYTMYTREHGKLVVIGKGTRRAKAKLAAHLEPFTEADLVIARGRTIDRITFARTIRAHATALRTYDDVQVASFLVECVEQLTEPQHRDAALFELLQTAVALVTQHAHAEIITPFLLRCLSILGYAPHLDRCAECRANLPPGAITGLPLRGGAVCGRCASSVRRGIPISEDDRERVGSASAAFGPFSSSPAIAAFAQGLLEAHLWQPLRTANPVFALTRDPEHVRMAES